MTSIRPALASADRALDLEIAQRNTIAHLRATAREIGKNLYSLQIETGEIVALQDAFEKALMQFCTAMRDPTVATAYVAPTATRLKIEAAAVARVEEEGSND